MQPVYHVLIRMLAMLSFLLAMGDIVTTYRALAKGAVEANPIMKFFMDKLGSWWVLARLGLALVIVVVALKGGGDTFLATLMLAANCALLGWVVWHNNRIASQ